TNIGQNIVTNTTSNAITVTSTGGNVVITTGNNTIPGEVITGNISGIVASTTGNGTVNVNTIANVTGLAGGGITTTTVDGSNAITVGGNVVAAGSAGVSAVANGNGTVVVNLGNVTTVAGNTTTVTPFSVTAAGSFGVGAENFAPIGNQTATINVTDPGNVTLSAAGASDPGIGVLTDGNGTGSRASVIMSGAPGGTVSVEGAGADWGVLAETLGGGTATVVTNGNRTISVGTKGGNGDIGVDAISDD